MSLAEAAPAGAATAAPAGRPCADRTCGVLLSPRGVKGPPGSRQIAARGLCSSCYHRHARAGTLDTFDLPAAPPPPIRRKAGDASTEPPGRFSPGFTKPSIVDAAIPVLTPEIERAAMLQVCGRAVDAAEAHELLVTLGLAEGWRS